MRETHHSRAMVADLHAIADLRNTELGPVQVIDDYAIFELHVLNVSLHQMPRLAKAAPRTKPNHLDVFHSALRFLPERKILNVLFRLLHSRRAQNFVVLSFLKHPTSIEIAYAVEHHPQVGVGVVDIVGSCGGETEEQPELHDDQHQGEHDTGKRHREADAVMKQVTSRQKSHGFISRSACCDYYDYGKPKVTSHCN